MRVKLYHVADESLISQNKTSSLFLIDDNWDDFGYKTRFKLYYVDQRGKSHEIGPLKITYKGYRADSAMAQYYYRKPADRLFYGESKLFAEFCSLGESLEYYENLWRNFPDEMLRLMMPFITNFETTSLLNVLFSEKVVLIKH